MTCRLYIDEVGNSDLKGAAEDDNVRYLSLTGIITKQAMHDRTIQPTVDTLKSRFFGHTEKAPVILHRRDIVRREGPFAVLRDPDKAIKLDNAMVRLFATLPYIAITVLIDKKLHLERYGTWHFDPYHYCMRCLIERYVLWLRRHDFRGDVVIEPRFKKADKRLKASFRTTYEKGTENIPERIVRRYLLSHDLKFIPKLANCAGLQICDLLAHPSARSMRFERDGLEAPDDYGTKVAKVLLDRRYARNPQNGDIEGWGRKWLP